MTSHSGSANAQRSPALISPAEHLANTLAQVVPLDAERLPLAAAFGRTLADDAHARHDLPLWDNSAMDGYALRAADIAAASPDSPVALTVVGAVLAGDGHDPAIAPGTAVRIMTGAPVPSDATAVLPVERTLGDDPESAWAKRTVHALEPALEGAHIRRRGEDIAEGSLVGRRGDRLTAARISALAAAGIAEVSASRLPRVAVLVTGSELSSVEGSAGNTAPLARGRIPESNSVLIASKLRECGIEAIDVRRCADDPAAVAAALAELACSCDAVISTGGIGPGSHDVVRIALEQHSGVRRVRVAMRPGQLQGSGRLTTQAGAPGALVFALPGNPIAAVAGFEMFVRPALLAAQGRDETQRRRLAATATTAWRGAPGKLQFLPVICEVSRPDGDLVCRPAVNPRGVSHAVGGHGAANGYALIAPERGDVAAGDTVTVMLVDE